MRSGQVAHVVSPLGYSTENALQPVYRTAPLNGSDTRSFLAYHYARSARVALACAASSSQPAASLPR
jgi:hypothetical protein